MPKIPKTNEGTFRKKLIQEERRKYLEGKRKSKTWQEVKQLPLIERQRTNAKIDQEIALYLPLLNFRQNRVILSLLKALASKQDQFWQELYKEQRQALKQNLVNCETTVTSTKVPGVDMTRVIASPPHIVKENSARSKK
jgi:hypothetical protein